MPGAHARLLHTPQLLFGGLTPSTGHGKRICKILRSEWKRRARLLRDVLFFQLNSTETPRRAKKKWLEVCASTSRTTEKMPMPRNPIHTACAVPIPDSVQDVLSLGPKFAVQPQLAPPELLTLTPMDMHLFTKNGAEIPRKDTICVLGKLILEHGMNAATIQKLQQHTAITVRHVRRISAGKAILARVGITSSLTKERAVPLRDTVRSTIVVRPLPRNMNPVHIRVEGERGLKAFLSKLNSRRESALFVDAYRTGPNSFVAASVRTEPVWVVEQDRTVADADRRANGACLPVPAGTRLCPCGAVMVHDSHAQSKLHRRRTGHTLPPSRDASEERPSDAPRAMLARAAREADFAHPNEIAHARARGLILRPGQTSSPHIAVEGSRGGTGGDPLTTFHEITSHYRLGKKSFPDPHRAN
ncbi:hypothetical protein HPB52_006431 [Rhipicephalus sanguineus]|uniref:Tick transposon n=1 Tax=Rhipicephalus sanguineus TaxID=34632 RepID=A0A9D4Q573_RHISA|nr:hypothetical protein HPB52_006431 [Rhipicephalus sanguineus]